MKLVALRLPEELIDELETCSKQLNRSKSFIIRKSVEKYLEDYIDYQIALDRLNDKDDEIISSTEMRKLVEK